MSNLVTAASSQAEFEEKMMVRLRSAVGELMPESELKRILEEGVRRCLFDKRTVNLPYGRTELKDSFVEQAVLELLEKEVKVAVDAWIKEHHAELLALLEKTVQAGMTTALARALQDMFSSSMMQLQDNLRSELRSRF